MKTKVRSNVWTRSNFLDEEEFHAVMGTKRKYADADPDSSTASKKEKSNGKGES